MGQSVPPGGEVCAKQGKQRLTKSAAKSAAKRMERRHGKSFGVYECWHCRGWHVGTTRR